MAQEKPITREQIVRTAESWYEAKTPFAHQQKIKGLGVDCDNFIAEVARECGAQLKVEWTNDYRRREDGSAMLAYLEGNLVLISDKIEDATPGDVIAWCDERLQFPEKPVHVGFLTEWKREGIPYAVHASEHGVRRHRLDALWKKRTHSVWRWEEIFNQDLEQGCIPPLARELAEQKIAEFKAALKKGEVADPITATIFGSALLAKVVGGAAVSAALSLATYGLSRAFAPKPPTREIGGMSGSFMLQPGIGIFITEIYGADPGDNLGGGARVGASVLHTSGLRRNVNVTRQPTGGGKGFGGGRTQEVREIFYDLDIAYLWGRGRLVLRKMWFNADVIYNALTGGGSGIYDPGPGPDPPYDPGEPPDPRPPYLLPLARHQGELLSDGDGAFSGTTVLGGYSGFVFYEGSATQNVDPTVESHTDAEHGIGSTPAYRVRSYSSHARVNLSRWNGAPPNPTAVLENADIKTLEELCEHWSGRTKPAITSFDYTQISLAMRGLRIAGGRYAPAELLEGRLGDFYNVIFTEPEGILTGLPRDGGPILELDDSEIGWIEEGNEPEDTLPEIDSTEPEASSLPRKVEVRYVDPARDFETNIQSEERQVVSGEETETLEVEITATPEEARRVAQRKLYQAYVEKPRRFTLDWSKLFLYPGYQLIINRAEGFQLHLLLTKISGGIGLLECEAVDLEPAIFTQPVAVDGWAFEVPPVPIPAMTMVALMDTPLLRDADATVKNGVGFYACGTPRTNDTQQAWPGFSLWVNKVGDEQIATFDLPATMGRAASVLPSADHTVFDRTGSVTVDLFGTTLGLESATELDVLNGANAALLGDEVIQFTTAVRDGSEPNRWVLSGLLRGRRGTEWAVNDHVEHERFVLLNEAVQFVPINLAELNQTREYRAVTAGQSLDDAATVNFAWLGGSAKPLSPILRLAEKRVNGDWFFEWLPRPRFGGALRDMAGVPLGEEEEIFQLGITSGATSKSWRLGTGAETTGVEWEIVQPPDPTQGNVTLGANGFFRTELTGTISVGTTVKSRQKFLDYVVLEVVAKANERLPGVGFRYYTPAEFDITEWVFFLQSVGYSGAHKVRAEGDAASEQTVADGDRFSIEIKNGKASYYKNFASGMSTPFYVSDKVVSPERLELFAQGFIRDLWAYSFQTLVSARVRTQRRRTFLLTKAMQENLFGAELHTLSLTIAQESALVGAGYPLEVTI